MSPYKNLIFVGEPLNEAACENNFRRQIRGLLLIFAGLYVHAEVMAICKNVFDRLQKYFF